MQPASGIGFFKDVYLWLRAHLPFDLGVKNAMPAEGRLLQILVAEGRRVFFQGT